MHCGVAYECVRLLARGHVIRLCNQDTSMFQGPDPISQLISDDFNFLNWPNGFGKEWFW